MSSERLNLHLIPGISASGKTTAARFMARELSAEGISASHVVPHTTRAPRPQEVHGIDYYFHPIESFYANHPKKLENETWRYSMIGDNFYFNSDEMTLPNHNTPVTILPVAYSAVLDIINDYKEKDNLEITVIPIIIAPDIEQRWLGSIWAERPERDLKKELDLQNEALDLIADSVVDTFTPAWDSKQTDLEGYYNKTKPHIITSTLK